MLLSHYLLGNGESYGPTAKQLQDFPIFIQLNNVHKSKQNKVLAPYVKLPCLKVAPGILLPLSQFSHFAQLHFWQQLFISLEISL